MQKDNSRAYFICEEQDVGLIVISSTKIKTFVTFS